MRWPTWHDRPKELTAAAATGLAAAPADARVLLVEIDADRLGDTLGHDDRQGWGPSDSPDEEDSGQRVEVHAFAVHVACSPHKRTPEHRTSPADRTRPLLRVSNLLRNVVDRNRLAKGNFCIMWPTSHTNVV